RPNWEKAENGLAQAEEAMAAQNPQVKKPAVAPAPEPSQPAAASAAIAVSVDPERTVDPNVHGALLNTLHRATIESENHSRTFLQILEKEIEPAIKELSTVLLYPNSPLNELDACVQKFESAINSIRSAQRSLQSTMEQVRTLGERLVKS